MVLKTDASDVRLAVRQEKSVHHLRFTIYDSLNPVHGVKEVFALGVDSHAQLFAFGAQTLLQFAGAFTRTLGVGDDDHGELSLHHRLIMSTMLQPAREYLRNSGERYGWSTPNTK